MQLLRRLTGARGLGLRLHHPAPAHRLVDVNQGLKEFPPQIGGVQFGAKQISLGIHLAVGGMKAALMLVARAIRQLEFMPHLLGMCATRHAARRISQIGIAQVVLFAG